MGHPPFQLKSYFASVADDEPRSALSALRHGAGEQQHRRRRAEKRRLGGEEGEGEETMKRGKKEKKQAAGEERREEPADAAVRIRQGVRHVRQMRPLVAFNRHCLEGVPKVPSPLQLSMGRGLS